MSPFAGGPEAASGTRSDNSGFGGVPKGPLGQGGRGKRGGLRIIYYWLPVEQTFYMLYIFSKTEQGDLTPSQTRTLGRLVREEFK